MPIVFLSYVWCHVSNGTISSMLWYGLCAVKLSSVLFVVVNCCVLWTVIVCIFCSRVV